MEAVTKLYKYAWNTMDTYTPEPPNYTPLLGDRSVHSPIGTVSGSGGLYQWNSNSGRCQEIYMVTCNCKLVANRSINII
jgi:hypothetical protein